MTELPPPPATPPTPAVVAAEKPPEAKPGFLTVAAGILFLIVEYMLKGIWAFIRFFLPRWMK